MGKERLDIIKIGGAVIEDPSKKATFLEGFLATEGRKILIHGGGRTATEIGKKLGIEAVMIEGRRVTDDATIDLVTMVYGGLVNKQLVAGLQSKNANAIGLTGADASVVVSQKRPIVNGADYGWAGDPIKVNDVFLANLLEGGHLPVIAPLTHDGKGHILNTNADTVAGTVAAAMARRYDVNLVLAFELDGIMTDKNNPGTLIKNFKESHFKEMKASGTVNGGMIPKLENAFAALRNGARTARICKFDQIHTEHGSNLQL